MLSGMLSETDSLIYKMLGFLIITTCYLTAVKGACCNDCCVPDTVDEGSCFDECFADCIGIRRDKCSNCAEIMQSGVRESGIYTLHLKCADNNGVEEVEAYCDMDTDGGGWTVFQNRFDGSVSFYQDWNTYKQGFGNLTGEFWWGNDNVARALAGCSYTSYTLRIDMKAYDGREKYAKYTNFTLADESDNYRIKLGTYSGTAGNSATLASGLGSEFLIDGKPFTTYDKDNDEWHSSCSLQYGIGSKGPGWWFGACIASDLNGKYKSSPVNDWKGVVWYSFFNDPKSLKETIMMFRPTDFLD